MLIISMVATTAATSGFFRSQRTMSRLLAAAAATVDVAVLGRCAMLLQLLMVMIGRGGALS